MPLNLSRGHICIESWSLRWVLPFPSPWWHWVTGFRACVIICWVSGSQFPQPLPYCWILVCVQPSVIMNKASPNICVCDFKIVSEHTHFKAIIQRNCHSSRCHQTTLSWDHFNCEKLFVQCRVPSRLPGVAPNTCHLVGGRSFPNSYCEQAGNRRCPAGRLTVSQSQCYLGETFRLGDRRPVLQCHLGRSPTPWLFSPLRSSTVEWPLGCPRPLMLDPSVGVIWCCRCYFSTPRGM